jgi:DNA-binding CsgD family transcriptional regulator
MFAVSGTGSAEVLHGREAERRSLALLLGAAREGSGRTTVLLGDAGLGKSALAAELVRDAEAAGTLVLRSRAIPGEEHVPFAALGQLTAPVADRAEGSSEPGRAALAAALGHEGDEPPAPPTVAMGLIDLLGDLADEAEAGVLLLVDDAHWIDEESLRALSFALRRMPGDGISALLAARPEPDRGIVGLGFEAITLGPLDPAAAAAMAAEVAGAAGTPVERALELAAGNPLAIRELTAALTSGGEQPHSAPLPPSALVAREFGHQLAGLAEPVREALVVLAAEEDELAPLALARLGLDPDLLETAEAAGVLVPERGGRRFRHPLLRSVAYHGAPLARRREAHRAWAELDGLDPIRRAWHLAATAVGPDEEVATALTDGAGAARRRGGTGSAAEAMARAAELTPDPATRARRLLTAARFASRSGRPETAIAHADAGLALAEADDLTRAELAGLRATQLLRLGDVDRAHLTLVAVAEEFAERQPVRAAVALLVACVRDRVAGDLEAMLAHAGRAAELAAGRDPLVEEIARGNRAAAEIMLGREGAAAIATLEETAPALAGEGGFARTGEFAVTSAQAAVWIGRHDLAAPILERRIQGVRALGELGELAYPLTVRSQLQLRRGRLAAALADAAEALDTAAEGGLGRAAAEAAAALAAVEAVLGAEAECVAHAEAAISFAEDRTATGLWARAALAALFLGTNRPEKALPPLRAAAERMRRMGLREPAVLGSAADLVEALVRTGDTAAAAAALTEWFGEGGIESDWRRGALARCHGFLAEGEEAAALFEHSAAAFEAGDLRFEAARSRLYLGERLRRDRQRRRAREPLTSALETFDRIGARPWAERARDELRATGQEGTQDESGFADGLEELTPHELRVALAVAGGRSNPEVAAELYVTRKTVEYHLTRVFRKLGVASRAELVRLLADRASGGASPAG